MFLDIPEVRGWALNMSWTLNTMKYLASGCAKFISNLKTKAQGEPFGVQKCLLAHAVCLEVFGALVSS